MLVAVLQIKSQIITLSKTVAAREFIQTFIPIIFNDFLKILSKQIIEQMDAPSILWKNDIFTTA